MENFRSRRRMMRWLVALVAGVVAPAWAADPYPARSVRLVVPYSAGGGTDVLTRPLAQRLAEITGQSFVVDNKPGADASIGAALVAKAPPDGYTLVAVSGVPFVLNQSAYKDLPYDTMRDLVPVAVFTYFLRADFTWPADAGTAGVFLFSVLMAGLIQFFLAYTLALLAFWVLDVSTFIFIQFAFEYLASGHLFPLDLLPAWLAQMLKLTPYPYLCWFPVSVYLGRVTGPELWTGLAIQAAWVAAGYALARHVWARGIRKYSAVGG